MLAALFANVRREALDYRAQRKREEKALRPTRILDYVESDILNEAGPS